LYLQLLNLLLISHVRMFLYIRYILILFSFSGYCQVLDDSTKQIYGAKTTQHFTHEHVFHASSEKKNKEEILRNGPQKSTIDTSLLNLHNYNYYFKNGILYQDLGNFGTPLNRVYYEPPTTIGKKLGFNALTEYGYDPDKIKFYDTKSPYTKLFYIQGSRGQQSMEVEHSQNVRPNWNIGFSLKRMTSLQQLAVSQKGVKQMSHYSFMAQTSYFSKDKRYTFLFSFTHLDHTQYENGGILPDANGKSDMFYYKLEQVQLYSQPFSISTPAHLRSYNKQSNFRFYNEYAVRSWSTLHVFHQFDYHTEIEGYDDNYLYNATYPTENNSYYYRNTIHAHLYFDTLNTHDRTHYELYENKVGLKGSTGKLTYMGYYRRKDFRYSQTNYAFANSNPVSKDSTSNYNSVVRIFNENFIGGRAQYRFSDTSALTVNAEYYIGRDYLLKADYSSKYLNIVYTKMSYSPTLFQLQNVSNSYIWNNRNKFTNTYTDAFNVNGKFKIGKFHFSPFANFTNIQRLIYFDSTAMPAQSTKAIQMMSVGFSSRINFGVLYLENYLRYTKTTGADVWRVPELFNQGKIYVYGPLFRKALFIQLGVDLSFNSGYYGNSYSPVTQQFYLSNRNNSLNYIDPYLLADVFLNTQIKRAFIFLKYAHANMNLPSPGYFITPYYTGMPSSFEFGIRWSFHD
jgi:hypothetical protein